MGGGGGSYVNSRLAALFAGHAQDTPSNMMPIVTMATSTIDVPSTHGSHHRSSMLSSAPAAVATAQ